MLQKTKTWLKSFVVLTLASFVLLTGCNEKKEPTLRILTWTEYFSDEVIKKFEDTHKIKVKLDYITSNEELLAKIQFSVKSGEAGYDLIMPSDYMVTSLVKQNLLKDLDPSKITVLNNISSEFKNPQYDSGLKHSIPVAWGTTAIALNKKVLGEVKADNVSWKDLFENPKYKGQLTLLDDIKEVTSVALLATGKSWETATNADIENAFQYLTKNKKQIKIFTPEAEPVIEAGECGACHVYSGTALRLGSTNPDISYVIPKEGGTLWTDNLAIPVNAAQLDLAYAFINDVLSDANAKDFMVRTFYASSNGAARKALPVEFQKNSQLFPTTATFSRLHYLKEREEMLQLVDRLWTEFKSGI